MKGTFPIEKWGNITTPFYFYDTTLLKNTLEAIKKETDKYNFTQHYAIKANANPRILKLIASYGFGADCVSGGEVRAAIEAGFPADKVVFAGVGKADWEINLALDADIFCFNVESLAELYIINELAIAKNKIARVEFRVNPNVDAHTHAKITTGLSENKFGINLSQISSVIKEAKTLSNIEVVGLHFHIGSQITDMSAFKDLCIKANELQDSLEKEGFTFPNMNFGGGLGIDYHHPNHINIPDFENYFAVFNKLVERRDGQNIHFELGRAVVGQCGNLISRVLYVKEGEVKRFAILDAGFTELIRPAMYDAYHRIENLSSNLAEKEYDVVGPICESSDVFGKEVMLNEVKRGDIIALRSAGAYGEVMSSQYNLRNLPNSYFSEDFE
ncbi:MAG: diaminopimelate decarboxylase [Paludibacteraceae bacterium]|nr:diaminopimelate decarboxylase [Paludibacteraceae bacterium]